MYIPTLNKHQIKSNQAIFTVMLFCWKNIVLAQLIWFKFKGCWDSCILSETTIFARKCCSFSLRIHYLTKCFAFKSLGDMNHSPHAFKDFMMHKLLAISFLVSVSGLYSSSCNCCELKYFVIHVQETLE